MIPHPRGGVAVFFLEGAREIFLVGKAAKKSDLLDRALVFDQKLQRLIHAQLDDILLGGYAKALQKGALQAGGADKALLAHAANIQRGLAKMRFDILQAGDKRSVLLRDLLVIFNFF